MFVGIEERKRIAAKVACDFIEDGMVIGVGSGSTVRHFIELLGQKIREENLKDIVAVPSSYETHFLLAKNNVRIASLVEYDQLDITIDGADSVLLENKVLVKGGGGALFREKIINYAAKRLVIIVDDTKIDRSFPIPVEVHVFAIGYVVRELKERGFKVRVRESKCKVGPCISDNGNILLDIDIPLELVNAGLEKELNAIPGVIENGIFSREAEVIVGKADGSYDILWRK
ncbi:MAG: ribose 5-phosphate isomerase A [Candidatus Njordarchaeales archaeon]